MSPVHTESPAVPDRDRKTPEPGMIDSDTLGTIRQTLELRKQELDRQLETSSLQDPDYLPFESGDLGASDDPAELVFGLFERDRCQSIVDTLRRMVDQNQRALDRLDAGTYGACSRCAQPIAAERLKAIPSAEMCVACQQVEDRSNEFRTATAPKSGTGLWG